MTLELPDRSDLIRSGVALAPLTTYRFGGRARFYAEVADKDGLLRVLEARLQSDGMPLLILGRGSNVVVSDSGFDGLVIRLVGSFLALDIASTGDIAVGGAVPLPRLARESVKGGRGGLEWCVGIPGSVGGAIRMNAGGHGSDTASWLLHAEIIDAASLTESRTEASNLGLSYRHSSLGDTDIVIAATFRTDVQDRRRGEEVLRGITRWRRDHQPGGTLNAGSVFKNPPGDTAGRIIDALGLKGYRVGGATVSERHANFFEANESATAQDVHDLVLSVRDMVAERAGVTLEPEIRFVGEFRLFAPEVRDK